MAAEAVVGVHLAAGAGNSDTNGSTEPEPSLGLHGEDIAGDAEVGTSAPAHVDVAASIATCVSSDIDGSIDEEIQEVPNQNALKKAPEEVIILSSDSEDEGERETKEAAKVNTEVIEDHDTEGVELIQELPYSYMNRPRGPKTGFLKSLLQQTNREIEQGRKIRDNTYQKVDFPLANFSIPAQKPCIQEVTLSSSEEEEEVDKEIPSTSSAKHDCSGQMTKNTDDPDSAHKTEQKSDLSQPPVVPEAPEKHAVSRQSRPTTPIASSSTLGRKRSYATDATSVRTNMNLCAHSDSARASIGKKKKKTDSLRLRLEKRLAEKTKELDVVGIEEVDLGDEVNSAFLKRIRLGQRLNRGFERLCKSGNTSTKVGGPYARRIKLSSNLSQFPNIEKAVEDFVNARKKRMPPTFSQVQEVVEDAVEKGNYPRLEPQEVYSLAEKLYEDVVKKTRCRRELDLTDSLMNNYCQGQNAFDPDPSALSPELAAELEKNDHLRKPSEGVQLELFAKIQMELQQSNPQALEDDCDSVKSDESGEEEDQAEQDLNAEELVNGDEGAAEKENDVENSAMDTAE